jgi:hypothetical protein
MDGLDRIGPIYVYRGSWPLDAAAALVALASLGDPVRLQRLAKIGIVERDGRQILAGARALPGGVATEWRELVAIEHSANEVRRSSGEWILRK